MVKYTYAERVAKKVNKVVAHIPNVKDIINNTTPSADLDEQFNLKLVYWRYYGDSLYATDKGIEFKPEFGNKTTILKYESFDDFLKMKV